MGGSKGSASMCSIQKAGHSEVIYNLTSVTRGCETNSEQERHKKGKMAVLGQIP